MLDKHQNKSYNDKSYNIIETYWDGSYIHKKVYNVKVRKSVAELVCKDIEREYTMMQKPFDKYNVYIEEDV